MTGLIFKINVLKECLKLFRNWHLYPLVYFKLVKAPLIHFQTRNNLRITLRTDSTDLMALTNVWLTKEYSKSGFEVKNNDVIIDVGAHIGLFSLLISKQCMSGKIFCFEPIKENFDLIISNLELNKITNVFAINMAASADSGTVTIYLNEDQAGHSMHQMSSKKIRTKSISLENIFETNSIEKCDFLKIDCEGEEYSILSALPDLYYNRIKKIFIEYHMADVKPQLLKDLISRLHLLAFKTIQTETTSSMGLLYASK